MYEYLEGTLQAILTDSAVLDIGGVGYLIHISKSCATRCLPLGTKIKLHVDLAIREDAHTLYGFSTSQDRDFFRLLQQVSGIGPRVALNILGHSPVPELAATLFRKDTKSLSSISGIGKKMAERLVVELHEKITDFLTSGLPNSPSVVQDAIRALQTLGFSSTEAKEAISTAQKNSSSSATIEQLIQYALSTKR